MYFVKYWSKDLESIFFVLFRFCFVAAFLYQVCIQNSAFNSKYFCLKMLLYY